MAGEILKFYAVFIFIQIFLGIETARTIFSPDGKSVVEDDKPKNAPPPPSTLTSTSTVTTAKAPLDPSESPCRTSVCVNEGICQPFYKNPQLEFICICRPGFGGKICAQAIPYCNKITCERKVECMSTATGSICACDTGADFVKATLCQMKHQNTTVWATPVVLNDTIKHLLVTVVSLTMSGLSLLAIFLCVHCRLASVINKMMREEYEAEIQAGNIPEELPPDLIAVSYMLLCESKKEEPNQDAENATDTNVNARGLPQVSGSKPSSFAERRMLKRNRVRDYNSNFKSVQNWLSNCHHKITVKTDREKLNLIPVSKDCSELLSDSSWEECNRERNQGNRSLLHVLTNQFRHYSATKKSKPSKDTKNLYRDKRLKNKHFATGRLLTTQNKTQHTSCQDPYVSSSSEEDIYVRPVKENINFSSTKPPTSPHGPETCHTHDRRERHVTPVRLLPRQEYFETVTFPNSLSPDFKENVCANNSIAKDTDVTAHSGKHIYQFESWHPQQADAEKSIDWNSFGEKTFFQDKFDHGTVRLQNEEILTHNKSLLPFLASSRVDRNITTVGIDKILNTSKTLAGIDEALPDSKIQNINNCTNGENKATQSTDSHTYNKQREVTEPKADKASVTVDMNDNGLPESTSKKNNPDGYYLKSFVKDGNTLYYVNEDHKDDVDNDIEVVPDGKGFCMVVSRQEKDGEW